MWRMLRRWFPRTIAPPEQHLIAQQQVADIWQTVNELSVGSGRSSCCDFWRRWRSRRLPLLQGCRLGTVKSHLYRALAIVREQHSRSAQGNQVHHSASRNTTGRSETSKEML